MDLQLNGKTALVTGATAGIGLAIASTLAREGVAVTITGRDREKLHNAVAKIAQAAPQARVSAIVADLATLLTNVNLNESMPEPPGCMSGPDDPDCGGLLPGFGLEIATGACAGAGCPAQSFFRVE